MSSTVVRLGVGAKHLGITRQWLLKLIKQGKITPVDSSAAQKTVTVEELRRYAADNDIHFYETGKNADGSDQACNGTQRPEDYRSGD